MQRYFIEQDNGSITGDNQHHMTQVMRYQTGQRVELCYQGVCYLAMLTIDKKEVSYQKENIIETNQQLDITLIQGLPKGSKIDEIVKYATIFGVRKIIFIVMKRSVAKLSNVEHKINRLNKIAKEAAELAKWSFVPHISFVDQLSTLNLETFRQVIVCDEEEKGIYFSDVLSKHELDQVAFIVGPEGGIDQKEREQFKSWGIKCVSLGISILPTELAHVKVLNKYYEIHKR